MHVVAKAVFLPVELIWPSAGRWGLPTGQNASVSQILTLAHARNVIERCDNGRRQRKAP